MKFIDYQMNKCTSEEINSKGEQTNYQNNNRVVRGRDQLICNEIAREADQQMGVNSGAWAGVQWVDTLDDGRREYYGAGRGGLPAAPTRPFLRTRRLD